MIGANTGLLDWCGHSAAIIAARNGHVNVLGYLLSLRGKIWNPLLEPLMISEHLLLVYAVQSRNRECVKLVLAQRQWTFGGPVFKRAMEYADHNLDTDLLNQLLRLYTSDEAIRTTHPVTGLTYHRPVDIPGVDWTTDLSPLKMQLPSGSHLLDHEQFSVDHIYDH